MELLVALFAVLVLFCAFAIRDASRRLSAITVRLQEIERVAKITKWE